MIFQSSLKKSIAQGVSPQNKLYIYSYHRSRMFFFFGGYNICLHVTNKHKQRRSEKMFWGHTE